MPRVGRVGLEPTTYGLKADYQDFYTVLSRIAVTIPSHFIRTPHPDFTATHHAVPPDHGRPARTMLSSGSDMHVIVTADVPNGYRLQIAWKAGISLACLPVPRDRAGDRNEDCGA